MSEQEQRQEVRNFFDLLRLHFQGRIDLFYIAKEVLQHKETTKSRFKIASGIPISAAYRYLIDKENVLWKNKTRGESVYWSFAQAKNLTFAFVDDIQDIERFKQENHFLLIQTSQHKYQAYFALSEPVDSFTLHHIQAELVKEYNGDPAATGWSQLRRVPGFINTKYDTDFVVRIVHTGSSVLDVSQIKPVEAQNHSQATNISNATQNGSYRANMRKSWQDFYEGDESQADMRYSLYLLGCGTTAEEVRDRLLKESLDIKTRKLGHLEKYLDLTIEKALRYIQQNSL